MADCDEIFDVRNNYILCNYQQAINDAQNVKPSSESSIIERDCYMYRSYIAQGKFNLVLSEINNNSHVDLRAVRILATYLQHTRNTPDAMSSLHALLAEPTASGSALLQYIGGLIYYKEGKLDDALRHLSSAYQHIESVALIIQILLSIGRVDLARKTLKSMVDLDEDASLTQLATAWVDIAIGGEKLQEAYYIFQELADKYTPTVMLLNGQAVCHIHQGRYEKAEELLQEALDRDSNNGDTLTNLITVYQYLNKSTQHIQRLVGQLQEEMPQHPFTVSYMEKESAFDREASNYVPSVAST